MRDISIENNVLPDELPNQGKSTTANMETVTALLHKSNQLLVQAIWQSEREGLVAVTGELLVIARGLENVLGAIRQGPNGERKFGDMKFS